MAKFGGGEDPRRVRARGYTLTEILTVISIITVIAALVLGVLGATRAYARQSACLTNLHQVGAALVAYRADWDDQAPIDQVLPGRHPERLAWKSLQRYARSATVFRCPDESGTDADSLGFVFRSGMHSNKDKNKHLIGTGPSSVPAYCMEHLRKHIVNGPFSYPEYDMDTAGHYLGKFHFVRGDMSAGSVDARQIETWVFDGRAWHQLGHVPPGRGVWSRIERFPGEPWPPEFPY